MIFTKIFRLDRCLGTKWVTFNISFSLQRLDYSPSFLLVFFLGDDEEWLDELDKISSEETRSSSRYKMQTSKNILIDLLLQRSSSAETSEFRTLSADIAFSFGMLASSGGTTSIRVLFSRTIHTITKRSSYVCIRYTHALPIRPSTQRIRYSYGYEQDFIRYKFVRSYATRTFLLHAAV